MKKQHNSIFFKNLKNYKKSFKTEIYFNNIFSL